MGWLIIVICVPTVGATAWLAFGRPWGRGPRQAPSPYQRLRHAAVDPAREAEFHRRCRERAQAQRVASRPGE